MAEGVGDGIGAAARAGLGVEVGDMALGGTKAHHERDRNLLAGTARGEHSQDNLPAWVIHVREVGDVPPGQTPLEWILLTNVPAGDFAAACERVDWYTCRPIIEEYHKAQKTGCGIDCSDGSICTSDRCDTASDQCVHEQTPVLISAIGALSRAERTRCACGESGRRSGW